MRTHIVSRCCVDAPKNHPHKWDYFGRVRRGVYEIRPEYRREKETGGASRVAERQATYGSAPLRDSLHATVTRGERSYVAECRELAVVTQGSTLDEVVASLREALALHLDGEDRAALGLTRSPRLVVTYESALENAPRLRRLSARDVLAALGSFGFEIVATRGSHAKLRRVTGAGVQQTLTVPLHKDLDLGTVRAIYRQAARFVPVAELSTWFYED